MARDLILHIGTTKTGSTAIQDAFSRNREALQGQGVVYPISPGRIHHNMLAFAAMADEAKRDGMESGVWGGLEPAERIAVFHEEFKAEMQALPSTVQRVVISSEFLTMFVQSADEIGALREMLRPWFGRITVVVYLRRQDAHFASLYTQLLRSGNVTPPGALRMRERRHQPLDYAALVESWESVFGEAAVIPRLYERSATTRFDVVADFAAICGTALPETGAGTLAESNPSMNEAGQTLLANLGRMIQERDGVEDVAGRPWYTLASAVTAASPGRGWLPSRDKARAFMAQYEASNEALRQRRFPERERLFSDDYSWLPETTSPPDGADVYEAACRTILELVRRRIAWEVKVAEVEVRHAKEAGKEKRLRKMLDRLVRLDPDHAGANAALARMAAVERREKLAGGLKRTARKP